MRTAPIVCAAVALWVVDRPPPRPSLSPPRRDVELGWLQGRWQRGDSGCEIAIDGPHFRETCPGPEALLYGDRSYLISFPQPGLIRLAEGGSYHEYGYARDRDAIYLGAGGAGRWRATARGDEVVAAALGVGPLLVMRDDRCWQHALVDAEPPRRFSPDGAPVGCEIDRAHLR